VHNLLGEKISIRILHIDAPEMKGGTECEKSAGNLAKQHLHGWLAAAKRIDLTNIQRDKYFRILADVMVDGQSVGEKLSELGLVYPYEGGTKLVVDWCPLAGS
jgi:endonuclease YncB( thermonuclease family)